MKNYWDNLNEREKWMVLAAALSLFIYGYYALLYAPLSNAVALKTTQLGEKTDTLAWMQKVRQQNRPLTKKQNVTNTQLLTILATQLKEDPTLKFPYQLQQTSSGEIELTFEQVPFQLLLTWLSKINEQYQIHIKQFDASKTETPGVSKVMLIISGL